MTANPTQEAIERLREGLDMAEASHTKDCELEWLAHVRPADLRRVLDIMEKQREALSIVDLYFEPWGAGKAAQWEDISNDKGFTAENALREIQKRRATLNKEPDNDEN